MWISAREDYYNACIARREICALTIWTLILYCEVVTFPASFRSSHNTISSTLSSCSSLRLHGLPLRLLQPMMHLDQLFLRKVDAL